MKPAHNNQQAFRLSWSFTSTPQHRAKIMFFTMRYSNIMFERPHIMSYMKDACEDLRLMVGGWTNEDVKADGPIYSTYADYTYGMVHINLYRRIIERPEWKCTCTVVRTIHHTNEQFMKLRG